MLKYSDGTKLIYLGNGGHSAFKKGDVYIVFRDGSSYEIPQIRELPTGWNSSFIEDNNQFRLYELNWQERIERLSKLEDVK
jgi:hypothetical protein